jgi:hypothetical protein
MAAPEPIIETTPPKEAFAEALGRLLQGRNQESDLDVCSFCDVRQAKASA